MAPPPSPVQRGTVATDFPSQWVAVWAAASVRCTLPAAPDPRLECPPASFTPALRPGMSKYGAGLQNLGNTCYMNSTVQCLYAVPELRSRWVLRGAGAQAGANCIARPPCPHLNRRRCPSRCIVNRARLSPCRALPAQPHQLQLGGRHGRQQPHPHGGHAQPVPEPDPLGAAGAANGVHPQPAPRLPAVWADQQASWAVLGGPGLGGRSHAAAHTLQHSC